MTDLAARCETAEGPDRGLDVEIAVAVEREHETRLLRCLDGAECRAPWRADPYSPGNTIPTPRYTESADAALTLIPDGMWWLIGKGRTRPDEPLYGVQILDGERVAAEAETEASAALAICAAALRARAG